MKLLERVLRTDRDVCRVISVSTLVMPAGLPVVKTLEENDFAFAEFPPKLYVEVSASLLLMACAKYVTLLGTLSIGKMYFANTVSLRVVQSGHYMLYSIVMNHLYTQEMVRSTERPCWCLQIPEGIQHLEVEEIKISLIAWNLAHPFFKRTTVLHERDSTVLTIVFCLGSQSSALVEKIVLYIVMRDLIVCCYHALHARIFINAFMQSQLLNYMIVFQKYSNVHSQQHCEYTMNVVLL